VACKLLIPLQELRFDGVLKQRSVAGDDGQPRGSDEVAALVLDRVIADDRALGNMHVAVDDGAPSVVSTLRESLAISS